MRRPRKPLSGRPPLELVGVRWNEVDWHILIVALMLLGFGLVFLWAMSDTASGVGRGDVDFDAHLTKLAVALPALAFGFLLRPRWLFGKAWWIYAGTIFLLALVPFIGVEHNNARRWIVTGIFDLQPSELAKIGVILGLARALHRNRLRSSDDWWPPVLVALLPMGLVTMQPDLGTALTIVPVTLGMLYLAGARAGAIARVVALAAVLGTCAFHFEWFKGYQHERIDTWLESWSPEGLIAGKRGGAFHIYQARVAIGNGGTFGTGLGQGIANETGYLPERDSDSIFAVIAEEAGFLGASALLFLYALLCLLLMERASRVRDRFSRLAVGGVALYFASHMAINVGVNLGLLPMTGLTLPLFSTGGSSLLASFLALGLALGLLSRHETTLDSDAFRSY